jgi:hypothetical protein
MTKDDCTAFIVEHFAERLIFTASRHWSMVREYEFNDVIFRDFHHDDGITCSVIQIGNMLFATDD